MSGLYFDVGGVGESHDYVSYGSNFDGLEPSYSSSTQISYGNSAPVKNQEQSGHGTVSYGNYGYQPDTHIGYPLENQPILEEEVKPEVEPEAVQQNSNHFNRSKPDVTISNVVSNFRCRCHLNLRNLAGKSKNVIYKREQGKVMMKLRDPHMMANIWSSGKIVCQGAKSEPDAKRGSRKFARIIQQCGNPKVRVSNYKVVNVLGNCRLPFAIDILHFSSHNAGPHCSYEPELHPAVTFKPGNGATVKIFSTGALTILGKNVELVEAALDLVYPLLYSFRKDRSAHDVDRTEKEDNEEY